VSDIETRLRERLAALQEQAKGQQAKVLALNEQARQQQQALMSEAAALSGTQRVIAEIKATLGEKLTPLESKLTER
jgi:hypothetical protein